MGQKDKRKGLIAGYKKLGPVARFMVHITIAGILLGFGYFIYPVFWGPTKQNQESIIASQERQDEKINSILKKGDGHQQTLDEIISLLNKHNIKDNEIFNEYQKLVYNIYDELYPNFEIKINNIIINDYGEKYLIDITIKSKDEILTAIKLMPKTEEVNKDDITNYNKTLSQIKATRGIIVSNSGFSDLAKEYSTKFGIGLYSIKDTRAHIWKDETKIPVVWVNKTFEVNFNPVIHFNAGDTVLKDFTKWKFSRDKGQTFFGLLEHFAYLWDNKKISQQPNVIHKVDENCANWVAIINTNNLNKNISDCSLTYLVNEESWLKYFEPDEYAALKNEITNDVNISRLGMSFPKFKKEDDWTKIDNSETFIKNNKGVCLVVTAEVPKLNPKISKKSFSLKRIIPD